MKIPSIETIIYHASIGESYNADKEGWEKPATWGLFKIWDTRSPEARCLQKSLKALECQIKNYHIVSVSDEAVQKLYNDLKTIDLTNTKIIKIGNDSYKITEKEAKLGSGYLDISAINTLKEVKELIMQAKEGSSEDLTENLEENKYLIINYLKLGNYSLEEVSDRLKKDEDVLMTAVKANGLNLKFVPNDMKSKAIVLEAVNQNGLALEFAPDELKNDEDVFKAALSQNSNAAIFINRK